MNIQARTRWALAIVGLLGGNAIAMAALVVSASDGGAQVIPAYYEQAVRYNDAIDAAARSRALGWRAAAVLDRGALVVTLRDPSGAPLLGARVVVTGHPRAFAARRFELELAPTGPGVYRASVPDPQRGRHDVVVRVARGAEQFLERVVVEAS